MDLIKQVPEKYESGYWYVVEASVTVDDTGTQVISIPITDAKWCATDAIVNGVLYAAVRTIRPVDVDTVNVSVREVLEAAEAEGSQSVTEKHQWRREGK